MSEGNGFICPDCKWQADCADALLMHYEANHGDDAVQAGFVEPPYCPGAEPIATVSGYRVAESKALFDISVRGQDGAKPFVLRKEHECFTALHAALRERFSAKRLPTLPPPQRSMPEKRRFSKKPSGAGKAPGGGAAAGAQKAQAAQMAVGLSKYLSAVLADPHMPTCAPVVSFLSLSGSAFDQAGPGSGSAPQTAVGVLLQASDYQTQTVPRASEHFELYQAPEGWVLLWQFLPRGAARSVDFEVRFRPTDAPDLGLGTEVTAPCTRQSSDGASDRPQHSTLSVRPLMSAGSRSLDFVAVYSAR
jgi:hypothetical protein